MAEESRRRPLRRIKSSRPGDRTLLVRTRRRRLASVERGVGDAFTAAANLFRDVLTQTLVVPVIAFLAVMVIIIPIPIFLIERSSENAEVTSYGVGLWWAVAAFTTVGHSDIDLVTTPGRILGSIYTIISVALFFGSVIAAFSSYFLLTWRRPKRQVIDTINYYLQRVDDLSAEELEELEELTAGVLHAAIERAQEEERGSSEDAS